MKRTILTWIGLLSGLALLFGSGYFYFMSGKTIYSSDTMKVNAPETSVTKTINITESGNPYKVFLKVIYTLKEDPKTNEYNLLSYGATIINGKAQIVEQKSSSYIYRVDKSEDADDPKGEHTDTITLFSLDDLPTDTYALSLAINPNQDVAQTVAIDHFSYEVKSNVVMVHPLIPVAGIILIIVSYFFMPKRKNETATEDKIA